MVIEFRAFGGLSVTNDASDMAIGGRRQRRLLTMLLIHRNTVVSSDRLADIVFDGEPTPGAGTTLRSYIARIRKVVEVDGSSVNVVTKAPGYMLTVPAESFDIARFEGLVSKAGEQLARDDNGTAATLRQALDLWRGDPYAEFDDEDWAQPESQRLAELRLVALETLFNAELERGRDGELIPEIEALVRAQPLRETPRRQLMLALYRSGRQADALASTATIAPCWSTSSGSTPRRSFAISKRASSLAMRRSLAARARIHCGATGSALGSAQVATASSKPPFCRASTAST